MKKVCIFCGKKPRNKNKEHVLPQWLIKMTGEANRIADWGIDYQDLVFGEKEKINVRKFPFMKYTFPACEECNAKYGEHLENNAKRVVEKIHNNQDINEEEINVLLNWFDKVRVGMWIGHLYYNSLDNIEPKFYISNRIATTDRVLFIFKSDSNEKGLNVVGPGSMLFSRIPIILGLKINEYYYVNISKDFVISEELGFPIPTEMVMNSEGNIGVNTMVNGTEIVKQKECWKKFFALKPEVAFFQAIYTKYTDVFEEVYEGEYIKNNSYDKERGLSDIFLYSNERMFKLSYESSSIHILGTYEDFSLRRRVANIISNYLINEAKHICSKIQDENIKEDMELAILYQEFIKGKINKV